MSAAVTPSLLYDLAGNVMAVVQAIYAEYGNDVRQPIYYYRTPNTNPTAVGDTIAVSYVEVVHIPPATAARVQPIKAGVTPRSAGITIWIWRTLTDTLAGEAMFAAETDFRPDQSEYDASVIMTDAYIVPWGLVDAHHKGQLGRVGGSGSPFSCSVIPMQASGGVGGCRVDLTLELS